MITKFRKKTNHRQNCRSWWT